MPRDIDSFLAADFPEAHAAARDAVRAELNLESAFGAAFIKRWNLFEVCTEARSKEEYLLQPDLGRRLNEASRQELERRCSRNHDIQIAIGDGCRRARSSPASVA